MEQVDISLLSTVIFHRIGHRFRNVRVKKNNAPIVKLPPDDAPSSHSRCAQTCLKSYKQLWQRAEQSVKRARELAPGDSEVSSRDTRDAALSRLIAQHHHDAAWQIAKVYAYRGETDQAFYWLDLAYSQYDFGVKRIKGDWSLKNLRSDPRYFEMLKKLNLLE